MAPLKKSKNINKGIGAGCDSSPIKDEKSKQKKRKLSDMLGPPWNKVELQRFYEAYRTCGKNWKKVASVVRSRSTEMVEALYNMNRAYLSLPEGTASVSGLIAMMTDHYNVMDGSGSEKDTEETTRMAHKVQKHIKVKGRHESKREISLLRPPISTSEKSVRGNSLQRPPISSSGGCLSLLRMTDGNQLDFPRKKRTYRVDVSCLDDRPNKKARRSIMNGHVDELSNGALLAEAKQNPNDIFEHLRNSESSAREKPKSGGFASDEESRDDSLSSYEARIEKLVRASVDSGSALADYKKGKKGNKKEVDNSEAKMLKNVGDTWTFSDERPRINEGSVNEGSKIYRSPLDQRKGNKKHITEDENVACDALQTLADLSLMMPYLTKEPVEDARVSVSVRDTTAGTDAQFGGALQKSPIPFKKRKSQALKVRNDYSKKQAEKENLADEVEKPGNSNALMSTDAERSKLSVKPPDVSSSNDGDSVKSEVAASSTQVQTSCNVISPTRRKSRRKRDRTILQQDRDRASSVSSSKCSSSIQDKEKICHCLSWPDVRRWCSYEWFYSAIDYPWFAKKDFVEYLNHVGLGHIPRLTRVEWGVIRSSLGKPRRFSERFLQEERDKLNQYRESVRTHYSNLRNGLGDGLPTDLARPLSVGQQVVVIHPKTRELHNGSVLTVDHQSCLIQFDRRDLGVAFVMDIDCMPLNPVENMPESLRRQKMSLGHHYSQLPKAEGALALAADKHMKTLDPLILVPPLSQAIANDMKVNQVFVNSQAKVAGNRSLMNLETAQSPDPAQLQSRKVDTRSIPRLTRVLDKKVLGQHCGSPLKAPCRSHPIAQSNGALHCSDSSMFSHDESTSNVVEIVQGSRERAQKMVDVAVKVVSSMREGDDAYGRIDEAFDSSVTAERVANSQMSSMMMSSNTVQGELPPQNPVGSDPEDIGDTSGTKPPASDLQIPSELITSCVATLLIIQTCTERQYPPAEVAQMLDNAVTSLHPSCSQNLSIYREIQMCMGRIKTQILALVPT